MYDVVVIGAGISGASVAYQLGRYRLRALVLEKENDVATGTTKANSAIVHAGYDPEPHTLMARYNVAGNRMIEEIAQKLEVPYRKCGSFVLAFDENDMQTLQTLLERGNQNGVPGLRLLSAEEVLRQEPHLNPEIKGALWAPSGGIVSPWELALAMLQMAVENGVELQLNSEVTGIETADNGYVVHTATGDYRSRFVVNAAGVNCDEINDMVADHAFTVEPNRGEYYLLDKSEGQYVKHIIFQCPSKTGKGVLVAPTAHGNLIVGPDSTAIHERTELQNTSQGLDYTADMARRSCPSVNLRASIRNFAGVRAVTEIDDFILGEAPDAPGFFNIAGIKSPGLTSAPAIAVDIVAMMAQRGLALEEKEHFLDERHVRRFSHMSADEKAAAIRENPLYGRVICRCETITEGEIVDALRAPIPPCSLDGVKRRTSAGMGRCQGGFCGPRVLDIIARERGLPHRAVLQDTVGSHIITGVTKNGSED